MSHAEMVPPFQHRLVTLGFAFLYLPIVLLVIFRSTSRSW
jgi:ABC-type spermidine/putrescine transport system permease subunit II